MNRFTTQPDAKLPGTFRVMDPAGNPITAAIPQNMADRIAYRRNYELDRSRRQPTPGHKATIRIVAVILAVIAILGCLQILGWDDAKTYALNHGQEEFDQ